MMRRLYRALSLAAPFVREAILWFAFGAAVLMSLAFLEGHF
jgi:hypothetical protein